MARSLMDVLWRVVAIGVGLRFQIILTRLAAGRQGRIAGIRATVAGISLWLLAMRTARLGMLSARTLTTSVPRGITRAHRTRAKT